MARVAHNKSSRHAPPGGASRGAKTAKQRKKHKVVLESISQDQSKLRSVISFRANPPPGYTFIPAGNPELTAAMKEFARKSNLQIHAVTTTPHPTRHELSREVHRVGFHFPTEVVSQVCAHYGIRLTSGGKLIEDDKDDDKLFMRVYQKGQLVLDEEVRDQVTINTEAKQTIKDLFPNIPDNDLFQIIKTAFQLGDGKVGTADEIPLVRRAQLSVVAHIRHVYTNYDKLLRQVPYNEARHRVEQETLRRLVEWRGDDDKNDAASKRAVDDVFREVVYISDDEDSDNDAEHVQQLEEDDLTIQPVSYTDSRLHNQPVSPSRMHAGDDAPAGYRYLPQILRRQNHIDDSTAAARREQARYAAWNAAREDYRQSRPAMQPARVVERIYLDETSSGRSNRQEVGPALFREPIILDSQPVAGRPLEYQVGLSPSLPVARPAQSTGGRDYLHHASISQTRTIEPANPPTYFRGQDGQLYERTSTHQAVRRIDHAGRRNSSPLILSQSLPVGTRPLSFQGNPPHLHQRTPSYENGDGSVLPSIEGPVGSYPSPVQRRNPFDSRTAAMASLDTDSPRRDEGSRDRRPVVIDLTDSAEQASKRRRYENPPRMYHAQLQAEARTANMMAPASNERSYMLPPSRPAPMFTDGVIDLTEHELKSRVAHQYEVAESPRVYVPIEAAGYRGPLSSQNRDMGNAAQPQYAGRRDDFLPHSPRPSHVYRGNQGAQHEQRSVARAGDELRTGSTVIADASGDEYGRSHRVIYSDQPHLDDMTSRQGRVIYLEPDIPAASHSHYARAPVPNPYQDSQRMVQERRSHQVPMEYHPVSGSLQPPVASTRGANQSSARYAIPSRHDPGSQMLPVDPTTDRRFVQSSRPYDHP